MSGKGAKRGTDREGEKGGIELDGRRKQSAPSFFFLFGSFVRSFVRSFVLPPPPPRLALQDSGDGEKECSCGFFLWEKATQRGMLEEEGCSWGRGGRDREGRKELRRGRETERGMDTTAERAERGRERRGKEKKVEEEEEEEGKE